jgi:exopolyphosphatase/guanosine-5'-triphosphate,3'-diphosphate pyrophosphatase
VSALSPAVGPVTAITGHSSEPERPIYAALDLGTNNCRLLVARPSRRGFLVIDAFSRIIRLGEGVTASGRLSDAAMARTIEALRICGDKMQRRGVRRSRLIATEACRIAANGPEFIARVERDLGMRLEIVSRETEAKLAVAGCASLLDRKCQRALVFDIGGGSSELVWLDLSQRDGRSVRGVHDRLDIQQCIAGWTSLPVGVVTLSERFGGRHVTPALFVEMVAHVRGLLAAFEDEHGIARQLSAHASHLLGTSGTVTTVAGVHLGLRAYDRTRVDGCWLRSSDVRSVSARLVGCSYEERVAQPCIGPDRADLVLAGCAILEAILQTWPCPRLRVADRGLREGILTNLMAEDNVHRLRRRQWAPAP